MIHEMNTSLEDKMAGLSTIFEDVVMRDNPNWYMVGFNVTAFMISTFFIGIIVSYLNAKVSSWFIHLKICK